MPIRTKFLSLVAILLIAVFFRFYHLTTIPPGLYMDEAMDGVNAQYAAQTGQFQVFYPEDNGREGLYVNLLAFAFRFHLLPDTAPWSVRVPAEVAGTLTVLGVYLLVSVLFKESREGESPTPNDRASTLALLSAFLLATSFWHINFSRIGFRAILGPFCLTWATYFLLMAIRSHASRLSALGPAAIAGIFYGLGFYTYIAFRITPLLLLLLIPFFRKTCGFWKCFILFLFVTILVALPISWYYLRHPADFIAHTAELSVTKAENPLAVLVTNTVKTALMFIWHGDSSWRHNFGGAPELWRPVGILFLLGLALGIWALVKVDSPFAHRPSRFAILFLLMWLILGSLPAIFSKGNPHALRSLLMVVPAVVFAALGGGWLYQFGARKLKRQWMAILTALFITVAVAKSYSEYFVAWAPHPSVRMDFNADSVDIGNRINALPASEPKYVVVYATGVIAYGLPVPVEPVLYVTHSFVPDSAAQKVVNNTQYLLPSEINQIPPGTPSSHIFEIR
jgi:hypothetical protein